MNPWNKIYQEHGASYASSSHCLPFLSQFFHDHHVKKILDLGCGSGQHLLYFKKQGFEVFGMDYSKEAIKIASQSFSSCHLKTNLKVASIHEKFPFDNQFFDAVISLRVLNHGNLAQIKKTISEIERILRSRGYLFFSVIKSNGRKNQIGITTHNSLKIKIVEPRTYIPLAGKEQGITHYFFNRAILLKLFKNFTVIKFWLETGKQKWEKYYHFLGQKSFQN